MPLPPTDGSTPPPPDNGALASSASQEEGSQKKGAQQPKRKRTRAGRQAEPTAGASNIPQHQQSPEHPSPKLRRVDQDRRSVVSASESLNPAATQTDPAPIEETIESMEDEDSEDATDIPPEVLSVLVPRHQVILQRHFSGENPDTAERARRVVQSAKKLLKTLRIRKIGFSYNRDKPPLPTLFARMKVFSIISQAELFTSYFDKATVFFSAVNTDQIKNTGCLSSMLETPPQLERFARLSDEEIRGIATHPFLKHIASMSSGRGFPTEQHVKAFMTMACLKVGWQPGNDEAVQGNPVDQKLLVHISSMNSGRGFPKKEKVEAFLSMPCLKVGWRPGLDEAVQNNPIDRDLLVHISSMCNGKGFPNKEQLEAFLSMPCLKVGWTEGCDEAVQNNRIDRELLIRIASMNSAKGIPTEAQVKAFVTMPCLKVGWKPGLDEAVKNNPIDLKLAICIASMNNGKGFPPEAQVKAFITMPCLKVGWRPGLDEAVKDNPIDHKLLRSIASINHSKGLPKEAQVKAFMSMHCLRVGWQPGNDRALRDNPIDRELITHIASVNHGKGFPTKKEVEAFISMLCLREGWQPGLDEAVQNNPVNRELLMRIASMRHDKGFPTKEQVEAFISMSCLKEGWQPGRDEAVKDKPIDWELLRNIASMNNGKGFPTREQVEAFVSMACLKEGWQPGRDEAVKDKPIDRELFMHIASMSNGRGFPTKRQVEVFISMSCLKEGWRKGFDEAVQNNPTNRELLIYIASICNGRGFPVEAEVIAFVQWLPVKNKKHCLKMASRVFAASGLPEQKELAANERSIRQYIPHLPELSTESDDISDGEDELEEDDAMNTLPLFSSVPQKWRMTIGETLKALALFCSAPPKWRMTIAELEQYLTAFTDDRNERTQVLYALASLIPMLFHHGGAGVRLWLARHHENQQDQNVLARALSIYAPLDNVKFALTQLPESECLDYITLCRKLNPAPNKLQWVALEPLRQKLNQQCSLTVSKARVLEILWSQPEAKRSGYVEKLDSFFKTVPSVRQLYLIHQTFKPQKMQDFLEACIARQSTHTLNVKQQELLLEGLLLAHYYLTDHEQIPDLCFSLQEASADGKGVIINGDALMPGQKRLWYFIAALLIELEQAPEYKFEKNRLTVLSNDRSIVLPKPEFSLVGNGFVIKNWSLEQLRTFFEAKDFTEQWYKSPQDERELYVRDERLPRNSASVRETHNEKAKLLAPSAILSIIKSGLPLKPVVWASLEHYANLGQLTTRLCRALAPVIQRQVEEAPDSVKNAVTARLTEGADETVVSQSYFATAMDAVIDALNRFQVLEETELEMLELFRHQMSPNQLLTVIKKMSDRVDLVTQLDWYKAYEGTKRDLLGLNEWLFEDDPLDE